MTVAPFPEQHEQHRAASRSRVRLLLAGVFVAVQLGLPLFQLVASPLPSRWGWQMFSRLDPRSYVVVLDDGDEVTVDLEATTVRRRAESDLERHLPGHLCRPGVRGIRVDVLGEPERFLPCV